MKKKILNDCLLKSRNLLHKHPDPKGFLHFSFIIQNNKVVGHGYNRVGSPIIGYPEYGKVHSEPDAYFQCKSLLQKGSFEVVNVRLSKKGLVRNSKPCKCCMRFLQKLDCEKVWFTTDLGFASLNLA